MCAAVVTNAATLGHFGVRARLSSLEKWRCARAALLLAPLVIGVVLGAMRRFPDVGIGVGQSEAALG